MEKDLMKSRPCKTEKQHAEVPEGKGYDKFPGMEKSMKGAGSGALKSGVADKSSIGKNDLHDLFGNAPKLSK